MIENKFEYPKQEQGYNPHLRWRQEGNRLIFDAVTREFTLKCPMAGRWKELTGSFPVGAFCINISVGKRCYERLETIKKTWLETGIIIQRRNRFRSVLIYYLPKLCCFTTKETDLKPNCDMKTLNSSSNN